MDELILDLTRLFLWPQPAYMGPDSAILLLNKTSRSATIFYIMKLKAGWLRGSLL